MFYCFKLLFISFLLAGSNLPESFCGKNLEEEHSIRWQYDYGRKKAPSSSIETKSDGDLNDRYCYFPIDIFAMPDNFQESGKSETRKDASFSRKYSKSNSSKGRSPSVLSRSDSSNPQLSKSSDLLEPPPLLESSPLLECMLHAVKLSLPPVVLAKASDPFQNFLGIIDDLSGKVSPAHLVAIAITSDTVEFFVDAATSCFKYFNEDSDGRLALGERFTTSDAAAAIKMHPMGAVALGATEVIAENVSIKYDKNKKPKYIIKHTGLFIGLGMAAVKTTKIGQIATKSTEGHKWLYSSVKKTIEENSSSQRRNHSPLKQIALIECVLNAITSTLSTPATHDQGFSVLELFIMASTPCYGLFKREESGKLGLGKNAVPGTIKLHPVGMLAVGSADAIMVSVSAIYDGGRDLQYDIKHTDLATRLGTTIVASTEIGQPATNPSESRLKRRVSKFFSNRPVNIANVLKCARECMIRYWESAWYTRGISDAIRGVAPRQRMPINLSQLLGCVARAIGKSLFGALFRERFKRAPQPAEKEEPEKVVSKNVLDSFVKEVTPCFGFIKRNEHGMLELDHLFLKGVVAEAIRLFPVGSLIAGTIESIADNVKEVHKEDGKVRYKINFSGLAIGLGMTAIGVTTFGIGGYATNLVRSFLSI